MIEAAAGIALYATVCMKTTLHGQPQGVCRELQLTPGTAGPIFPDLVACEKGMDAALSKWLDEAEPVFGFTRKENVVSVRCGPPDDDEGDDT